MNLRRLDLNLLTVFEAVYEDRNFTRAAERLGMTQPALSNAIKRLREEVGDPLFVRASGGVEPTARADVLAPHISTALNHVRLGFAEHGVFDPATAERRFKVCIGDFGEAFCLPELYRSCGAGPHIKVAAIGEMGRNNLNELRSGSLDLVWDFMQLEDGHLLSEVVFEDQLVCIMRQDHPLANEDLTAQSYLAQRHIVVRATQNYVQEIEQVLRRASVEREVAVEVDHITAMPFIAARSDLVSITAASIARNLRDRLGLIAKPLPFEVPPVRIHQTWHRRMQDDPAHIWLRDSFKKVAGAFIAT
ncbi:MAG: LysR family transcriptional regulator [Alphaproteobacteria bacterium]